MSQNTQKEPQVSEDLFTTQELLQENSENIDGAELEVTKEATKEVQMSLDFDEIADSDEIGNSDGITAESDNIVRDFEDVTEDTEDNIALENDE